MVAPVQAENACDVLATRQAIRAVRRSPDRPDRRLETGDVVTGDTFGFGAFAFRDRPQQADVLTDVPVEVGDPVQEQAEDPGGEVVVAHQSVLEVWVPRGAIDRAVHTQVPVHQLVAPQTADVVVLELVGEVGQFRADLFVRVLGGATGREGFQLHADLGDVGQVGDVHGGGEGAATGIGDHQPVDFEAFECFPDRCATHAEGLGHRDVVDRGHGWDVEHDQFVLERGVGTVGQRDGRLFELTRGDGHALILRREIRRRQTKPPFGIQRDSH